MNVLALGDSYTIGVGVEAEDRWPAQWCERMSDRWPTVPLITYVAESGWTASELLSATLETSLDSQYDFVTLLVGANDHYRRDPIATYESVLGSLLDIALTVTDNQPERVLVLSIPDWTVTPFGKDSSGGTQVELDRFNAVLWRTSLSRRVGYLDITPQSRLMSAPGDYVIQDGLHPSKLMYRLWASAASELLQEG